MHPKLASRNLHFLNDKWLMDPTSAPKYFYFFLYSLLCQCPPKWLLFLYNYHVNIICYSCYCSCFTYFIEMWWLFVNLWHLASIAGLWSDLFKVKQLSIVLYKGHISVSWSTYSPFKSKRFFLNNSKKRGLIYIQDTRTIFHKLHVRYVVNVTAVYSL